MILSSLTDKEMILYMWSLPALTPYELQLVQRLEKSLGLVHGNDTGRESQSSSQAVVEEQTQLELFTSVKWNGGARNT